MRIDGATVHNHFVHTVRLSKIEKQQTKEYKRSHTTTTTTIEKLQENHLQNIN